MYLYSAASITHQTTFQNPGFSQRLGSLPAESSLQHPDYRDFISKGARRRMSDVLKTAVVCAKDALSQADIDQPDGIIVGTAHGSSKHTHTFLDKIHASQGGLLSPTSFILSTHNTIAGQISLALDNPNYNTTYTQSSLSFEHALLDGMLSIREDNDTNILVGAADEGPNMLYDLPNRLGLPNIHATCGSSFFVLGADSSSQASRLLEVEAHGLCKEPLSKIHALLDRHQLEPDQLSLLLHSSSLPVHRESLLGMAPTCPSLFIPDLVGYYLTNSAFALALAMDSLRYGSKTGPILIVNQILPENLGLILVGPQSDEG